MASSTMQVTHHSSRIHSIEYVEMKVDGYKDDQYHFRLEDGLQFWIGLPHFYVPNNGQEVRYTVSGPVRENGEPLAPARFQIRLPLGPDDTEGKPSKGCYQVSMDEFCGVVRGGVPVLDPHRPMRPAPERSAQSAKTERPSRGVLD